MATQLDLQEQEQLDALKAFWKTHGNLITWTLVVVLAAYAAWNGWHYWQRENALQAAAMFEELDRAAVAGDAEKVGRIFSDLRERYPGTAYAEQGALTAAGVQVAKGQPEAARATLTWLAANAAEDEMRTVARLRLAGWQAEEKKYDEALKTLDGAAAPTFDALVADRRGDVLLLQGKKPEAADAYRKAWAAMSDSQAYKRVIEAKLSSLGAAPPAAAASAASGSAS